jgi:hypothetical protein
MHIHGHLMNLQVTGTSFAAAENAAARQRAADVRRKLLKSAQSVEGELSPEAGLMVGQWLDSRHSQVLSEDQYHPSAEGKDPDFG